MNKKDDNEKPKAWYPVFFKDRDRRALFDWWEWLDDNRGERARLRRCNTPQEVILQSGFHRLCEKLPDWEKDDLMGLATVAGLVAHVKQLGHDSLAVQFGKAKEGGDKPVMSEMRFQQIISSEHYDELYSRMQRAIHLLKGAVDITSLADGVFHWSKDQRNAYDELPSQRFQYLWSKSYFSEVFKYQKESK